MTQKHKPGCLAYLISLLAVIGAVVGWMEFFIKPIQRQAEIGKLHVADVLGDLLKLTPDTYGWPFAGYLLILSGVLIASIGTVVILRPVRAVLDYLDVSEAHISVLKSEIRLVMRDVGMTSSETHRTQMLHANAPKVSAYQMSITPLHGEIDADNVSYESRINDELITEDLLVSKHGKTFEIVERYLRDLPQNYWATYLPNWLVLWLYNFGPFFKKVIVQRTGSSAEKEEYCGENPYFQLHAIRYPVSDISITVEFFDETAPDLDDVNAWLITSNAVQKINMVPDRTEIGKLKVSVRNRRLSQDQKLRIQWKNSKLLAWQAQQPPVVKPTAG